MYNVSLIINKVTLYIQTNFNRWSSHGSLLILITPFISDVHSISANIPIYWDNKTTIKQIHFEITNYNQVGLFTVTNVFSNSCKKHRMQSLIYCKNYGILEKQITIYQQTISWMNVCCLFVKVMPFPGLCLSKHKQTCIQSNMSNYIHYTLPWKIFS